MDPTYAAEELFGLVKQLYNPDGNQITPSDAVELLNEIADRAQSLSDWLSTGGFMPEGWGDDG